MDELQAKIEQLETRLKALEARNEGSFELLVENRRLKNFSLNLENGDRLVLLCDQWHRLPLRYLEAAQKLQNGLHAWDDNKVAIRL